jgi:hypothetical protein
MRLELRIGIGTGPVVAGVVGKKKFIYDLWGDTVNIASRVTSEGVPGVVQVDERTYQRLQHRFDFQEPQTIYLKGKGNMVVHRLIGCRSGSRPHSMRRLPRIQRASIPPLWLLRDHSVQLEAHFAGLVACQAQFVAAALSLARGVIEADAEPVFRRHGACSRSARTSSLIALPLSQTLSSEASAARAT